MKYSEVFVLQHVAHEDAPNEDIKLIGVYSSRKMAEAAIDRLSKQPGFCDYPQGFYIDSHIINRDHWEEGFVSV